MDTLNTEQPLLIHRENGTTNFDKLFANVLNNSYKINYTRLSQQYNNNEINIHQVIRIAFYIIYALIFIIGIIGNTLVCYVVLRTPSMHSVTNFFIANLALSDIFLCLLSVPFTPFYLLVFQEWIFGSILCHIVPFAQGVSVYISVLTLMAIAIERYSVIVHPFRRPITIARCSVIIIVIWLASFILTLPLTIFIEVIPMVIFQTNSTEMKINLNDLYYNNTTILSNFDYDDVFHLFETKYYCDEVWTREQLRVTFGLVTTVLQFLIPFFIITFCYLKVCARLWDRIRTRPGSMNYSSQRKWLEKERAKRTNSMLISMVVIFGISWLPLNIYNLFEDFYFPVSHWKHSRTFFLVIHALAMTSTCYNPFLYAWLNDNFRKEFKYIFKPLWARTRCLILRHNDTTRGKNAKHVVVALHPQPNNLNGDIYNNFNTNTTNLGSNRTPEARCRTAKENEKENDDGECISMTVFETTTNLGLTTNLESINETDLQESLLATSQRNGVYRVIINDKSTLADKNTN